MSVCFAGAVIDEFLGTPDDFTAMSVAAHFLVAASHASPVGHVVVLGPIMPLCVVFERDDVVFAAANPLSAANATAARATIDAHTMDESFILISR